MSINTDAAARAVECVTSFLIIGLVGYGLAKRRWFSDESADLLTRLLTAVIIPVNLLCSINSSTTAELFLPVLPYMLVPAGSVLITMLVALLLTRLFAMERARKNVCIVASACSNTINIGLPVNLALFGPEAVPAVLLYYMGNTVVFWTLGNALIASGAPDAERTPVLGAATARRLFPPPICAFLVGLLLLVLDIRIPSVAGMAGSQLSSMTTPLSVLCIGIAMFRTGLSNIRLSRGVGLIALGRFVVSPLVILGLLHFFPVPEMTRNVFIIQSSLPPMSNIALLAMKYRADAGFAAVSVSFGTLCALVTVPAFMVLLSA